MLRVLRGEEEAAFELYAVRSAVEWPPPGAIAGTPDAGPIACGAIRHRTEFRGFSRSSIRRELKFCYRLRAVVFRLAPRSVWYSCFRPTSGSTTGAIGMLSMGGRSMQVGTPEDDVYSLPFSAYGLAFFAFL